MFQHNSIGFYCAIEKVIILSKPGNIKETYIIYDDVTRKDLSMKIVSLRVFTGVK